MLKRYIIFLFAIALVAFSVQSCGGSRKGDDGSVSDEEQRQKQELDEIEALLGVSGEERQAAKEQPKEGETLGLLNTREVVDASQSATMNPEEKRKMERQIKNLKAQIAEKDLIISDLKAQLTLQSRQLEESQSSRPARSSGGFSLSSISEVDAGEYETRYNEAYDLFHSGDYQGAIQLWESLLASDVNNSLADNAQYWIGEAHYALRQYSKAIIDFEKVFTFPRTNKADDAQFKLGLCYLRKGDRQKAREEFQRLLDVYPNSEFAARARQHLASL